METSIVNLCCRLSLALPPSPAQADHETALEFDIMVKAGDLTLRHPLPAFQTVGLNWQAGCAQAG